MEDYLRIPYGVYEEGGPGSTARSATGARAVRRVVPFAAGADGLCGDAVWIVPNTAAIGLAGVVGVAVELAWDSGRPAPLALDFGA